VGGGLPAYKQYFQDMQSAGGKSLKGNPHFKRKARAKRGSRGRGKKKKRYGGKVSTQGGKRESYLGKDRKSWEPKKEIIRIGGLRTPN